MLGNTCPLEDCKAPSCSPESDHCWEHLPLDKAFTDRYTIPVYTGLLRGDRYFGN